MSDLKGKDLISISDLSKKEMQTIFSLAKVFEKKSNLELLKGSVLANCFFEPSTRTRFSFETAMLRLGGSVIGFSESNTTSMKKGESLDDMMKVLGQYADLLVIRHPQEGSAQIAADATDIPVINAGDGANEHPSQTLIDLFTILQCQGKIEGLQIAIAGDLQYARTAHSLIYALMHFPVRLYFVSDLLPSSIQNALKERNISFSFHEKFEEILPHVDILYMTRHQKERHEKEKKGQLRSLLKKTHLENVQPHFKILHPLPRINEIEKTIDETAYAYYFKQTANAIPVRMALLALFLGKI